jgi:chlorophyll synthase
MKPTQTFYPLRSLLTNHIDACGVTLIIAAVCTILHGSAGGATLPYLFTLTLTAWLAFAVNDYYDAPYDAADPFKRGRNFFVQHTPSQPALITVLGCVVSLITFGFLQYGQRGLLQVIVALIAIWAYSAPPLRLKSRPIFDLIMHGLFVETAPYYATLYILGVIWTPLDYTLLALFFLGSLSAQLEQQARDFEVDQQQERNFATLVGLRPTVLFLRVLSTLFMAVGIITFFGGVIPFYFIGFALIGLPVILHRFIRRADQPRSQPLIMAVLLGELVYLGAVWSVAALGGLS